MDFGASASGLEARLCHLIFYLFGIKSCYSTYILATATHPTLLWAPIFHQQEDEDNGFTFFSAMSLRLANGNGGTLRRAGWVAFTKTYSRGKWLISHLPPTFAINYSHPVSLASLYLTSPRPRPTRLRVPYLMSSSPSSRFPRPHTRVPVCPSHFYTQPNIWQIWSEGRGKTTQHFLLT